ncbi:MAG: hypothetical protein ACJ8F7_14830 [Gemmataceae bacterium]
MLFKINEVSCLLVQAAQSRDPAERERAIQQLNAVSADLEAELFAAEMIMRKTGSRKVEVAAIRAAVTTLQKELAALQAGRESHVSPALVPASR